MHAGQNQGKPQYTLAYSASPFGFAVNRAGSSAAPLFNTAGSRLIFKVRLLSCLLVEPPVATCKGTCQE